MGDKLERVKKQRVGYSADVCIKRAVGRYLPCQGCEIAKGQHILGVRLEHMFSYPCWPTVLQWKLQESPSSCRDPLVSSTENAYYYAHLKGEVLIGILFIIAELILKAELGAE